MYYQKEKEGAERLENLEQLISAAAQFLIEEGYDFEQYAQTSSLSVNTNASNDVIASSPNIIDANDNHPVNMSPLSAFLSHASLEAGDAQADENTDAVQLMTVHAAKGLEFEAVFITGLEEGLFPHENSSHDKKGLEEERRLMYVALTRAKKKLYLSCAEYRMLYGHANYNKHSSFIDELPEENTKLMFKQKKASYIDEAEWGNIPSSKPQTSATHHKWRAGQSVYHKKFGEGVIIRLESGDRAFVNFGSVGMKHLDLTIAKLERL
jgi:DNA helicase-2/ATP-dependent DNA helicase PcrA